MSKTRGFTLVELIIVIVILGILAITAAPRFIDIQSDAQVAGLQGVKTGLNSAIKLVYAKSAIEGIEKDYANSIMVNGVQINTSFGYPHPWWFNSIRRIIQGWDNFAVTADLTITCSAEFCAFGGIDGNRSEAIPGGRTLTAGELGTVIWPKGYSASAQCLVYYIHPQVLNAVPETGVVTAGC